MDNKITPKQKELIDLLYRLQEDCRKNGGVTFICLTDYRKDIGFTREAQGFYIKTIRNGKEHYNPDRLNKNTVKALIKKGVLTHFMGRNSFELDTNLLRNKYNYR